MHISLYRKRQGLLLQLTFTNELSQHKSQFSLNKILFFLSLFFVFFFFQIFLFFNSQTQTFDIKKHNYNYYYLIM
jgi:hypothetical protein